MATTWTRQSVNSANQVVSSSSPTTEWSRVKIVTDLGVNTLSLSEVDYLTDSNGTGTLKNIDAIDATTEATIESAIDTLSNLTSIGTITTGVWNASAIADSYISSASTWNAKQNALTFGISNTNAVKIDAADVADDDYARFTANGLEGRTLAEIKSDIGTGNSGLLPSAGSSGQFLKHDGTFGQVSYNNLTDKLADFDNDNGGLVPSPGSTETTTRFLREDGNFAVPAYIANTNTNQLTTFTLGADGGTPQTIAHGNTLTISGGTGISTSVGATDQVEVSVNGVVLTTSDQSIAGNKTFTGVTTFDDAVGFDQITVTYNSADTEVNFKSDGNKAYLVPTGGITDLNLNMPTVSGNFVLIIKQDGTGSRTVTNYKVFDNSGSAASGNATVLFAGGSNPTLTTGANKTDILSFYWDADNEICYGVASLNF